MAKFFTYEGKQVGLVRKVLGDVVMIEEAWTSEVSAHLAKGGYDPLLEPIARILSAGGHPPVTRAQAWIILRELLKGEIPEVLQDRNADELSTKGNLFAKVTKSAASAVDAVASPVGKVVGGSIAAVSKVTPSKKTTEEAGEGDANGE